jgi:hypothetical protein
VRFERTYQNPQFWYDFLAWEHTACRRSIFHGEYQPCEANPIDEFFPNDEDDHYDIINQETDEAMEDAAPPGSADLPSEYLAVLAIRYDEEALLQQVLEASKADEEALFPNLQEGLAFTGMVAEHLASLPPPHLVLAHVPP